MGGGWTMESGGGQGRGGWIKESVKLKSHNCVSSSSSTVFFHSVSWEHCNMCAVVCSALPQAHVVSYAELPLFSLCLAASVPRAQTVVY